MPLFYVVENQLGRNLLRVVGIVADRESQRSREADHVRVRAQDPITLVAVPMGLLLVGLVACWLPALRTRHLNPIEVLKPEQSG